MRLFCTIAALLGLAGSATADERPATAPTTSPAAGKTTYTLSDDNNAKLAENPTADQIKTAISSLAKDKITFVLLGRDESHFMQAASNLDGTLCVEYADPGPDHMFVSDKHPPELVVKLFLSFISGKDDWIKMVKWKPLE